MVEISQNVKNISSNYDFENLEQTLKNLADSVGNYVMVILIEY